MPKKTGTYRLPRVRREGAAIFRRPLSSLIPPAVEKKPWETPPDGWPGSGAEWAVAWALTTLKVEFEFQAPLMGGRTEKGGTVADFYIPSHNTIIRVMGIHWHYEIQGAMAADDILKLALQSKGFIVIDIDEDDALRNPIFYVREALRGQDHSRRSGGR